VTKQVNSHSIMTDGTNRKHLLKNSFFFFNQLVLILKQDLTILFNVIQWFILLLTFIAFIVYLFFFLIAKLNDGRDMNIIAAFQVSTRVVPNYSRSTTSVPYNLWNYSRTTPLYPSPAP
jgi:hypothetical protein